MWHKSIDGAIIKKSSKYTITIMPRRHSSLATCRVSFANILGAPVQPNIRTRPLCVGIDMTAMSLRGDENESNHHSNLFWWPTNLILPSAAGSSLSPS
jgi:hypothetical protein